MLNNLSIDERLVGGKKMENEIAEWLIDNGLKFVPATEQQDMIEKTDGIVEINGWKYSVQIKQRESGKDVGVECYFPFYGVGHADTKLGRDVKKICNLYVYRIEDHIYFINGKKMIELLDVALEAWEQAEPWEKKGGFKCLGGIDIRQVRDKGKGYRQNQPKIMAYIPPALLQRRGVALGYCADTRVPHLESLVETILKKSN